MVTLNHPKSLLSSRHIIFSTMNNKSSSSSLTTMKFKTLIHDHIFSHICRVIQAFSKAKTIFLDIFRENRLMYITQSKKKNKYRNKILFGSFRLHYNWCSSSAHVLPIPSPLLSRDHEAVGKEDDEEGQLWSYLQWLEEKGGKTENLSEGEGKDANEIDKLADLFIASCHEKFRLEKIESYRRYQELLARSL